MRILITRPQEFSHSLVDLLKKNGMLPEVLPLIEIVPTENNEDLIEAISNLHLVDIAIFSSRSAALYGVTEIQKYWKSDVPNIQWAAIGEGTAEVLVNFGLSNILLPKSPPYETEALLDLPDFKNVKDKRIQIYRGNTGRSLLPESLKIRGALVDIVSCYKRILPKIDIKSMIKSWQSIPFNAIIITSGDALIHLKTSAEDAWPWFCEQPMVVISARLLKLSKEFNIKRVVVAKSARDEHLIGAIHTLSNNVNIYKLLGNVT